MRKKAKPVHVEVTPRKNESPERMIKRFIKKVKKEGILDEWREKHMFFEKPTAKIFFASALESFLITSISSRSSASIAVLYVVHVSKRLDFEMPCRLKKSGA